MSTATRTAPRLPGDLFIWYVILLEGATFCVLFGAFAFTRARHLELFSSSQQQLDLSAGAINTALLLTASWCVARAVHAVRAGARGAGLRGDAELGFQQASELLPFTELDYLGPIPDEVQQKVFFSAGVLQGAPNPEGAQRFIRYLASPAAAGVIESTGLTPVAKR